MKDIKIVLGLSFGDEGKGSTVNYLCNQVENPLVVRFSGGHQVGHTVVRDGKRHVFSNFGSGTLSGAPTYWSEYCTLNPMGVFKEYNALKTLGFSPYLLIDGNAMVTTPFDIIRNQMVETTKRHGSVGVGFGTTIQRNEDHYRLYARDLLFPKIRDVKLKNIQHLYYKYNDTAEFEKLIHDFKTACDFIVSRFNVVSDPKSLLVANDLIFEGSQGILLDMQYGFFPNVTRAYTTSRNAFELIRKHGVDTSNVQTYYITRAYQTRHGNGFMSNEEMDLSYIKDNLFETNIENTFQGALRKGVLDLDLIEYALLCDEKYNSLEHKKNLVITCLDQVPSEIPVTQYGTLNYRPYMEIGNVLGFSDDEVFGSFSDE
ncbi:MAG: adenylosuccinate synthetase, partial [bacterium]